MRAFRPPVMKNCRFALSERGPNQIPAITIIAMLHFVPGTSGQACMQACKAARGQCNSVNAIPSTSGKYLCMINFRPIPSNIRMQWTQCNGCGHYKKRCTGNCRMVQIKIPNLYYAPSQLKRVPGANMQQCMGVCNKLSECSMIAVLTMGQRSLCLLLGVGKPLPQPRAIAFKGKGGQALPLRYAHKVCR